MNIFKITIVNHQVKKQYDLSGNEYMILDFIWQSVNANEGYYTIIKNDELIKWSSITRIKLAKESGLTKSTVLTIIATLIRKGLVEKDENCFLRTTEKFNP
jgi:DNA-binding MarR family transcriptional regulator